MIRAQGLSKRYDELQALNDVSFEIGRGEIVGFLGPNGAGKSTTLRILTGFLSPSMGDAWIAGKDVSAKDESYRDSLGYLPEGAPLYPDMSVEQFLRFVARVRKVPSSERNQSIEWTLDACGLASMRNRHIRTLSKGYRQRVGIAQAIIHQPDVLILDEPTSGLDPNQLEEILALIRDYGEGRTVLFSSHILSEVQAICSRVLILDEGRVVADDTPLRLTERLSGHRYRLSLEGVSEDVALAQLATVQGVVELSIESKKDNSLTLSIELDSDDRRSDISKKVLECGWSLLEFRQVSANLDEIFRMLTGDNR